MLGTGLGAENVVIFLELIIAIYSVALAFNTDKKVLRVVHIVLGIMWAFLALINLFA